MEESSKISLLDLSSQFPFEIDAAIKKEICFAETLIISCGHYEGEVGGTEQSESEWSCHDTTETEASEEIKDDTMFEIKDKVEEAPVVAEKEEDDNDFHFYFFPDCKKPLPPQDSKASVTIVDGLPKINEAAKGLIFCTCGVNKKGECECHTKLPCKCGAKITAECICARLKEICICESDKPNPACICHKSQNVCTCCPDKILPICTCEKIDKPCFCLDKETGKFPRAVCTCSYKSKYIEDLKSIGEENEPAVEEEENPNEGEVTPPCTCQEEKKKHCLCLKGKDCICFANSCVCGVQKSCVCEPTDSQEPLCESDDSKIVCDCPVPKQCTCGAKDSTDCECFPKNVTCSCGDPENCKCFVNCDCTAPCICETKIEKVPDCVCLEKPTLDMPPPECTCRIQQQECTCVGKPQKKISAGAECTCRTPKKTELKKLKKVRAGKEGFRWCHDVDPRHTYFDYGYGRHDKISQKVQEAEKFKILGLHDEKEVEEVCAVDEIKAPPYEKKIRKPSIDCCSSVGGISICVESLGEDGDRLLVQVVSHSSKEGPKTGTKLVSILDWNLHTMEENRNEYLTKKNITKERRSYMAICETGYYNKITRICGEQTVVKRVYHDFKDAKDFLLEGANLVLLRYFGLRRHRGKVKTETVMMNGSICESIYVCNGVSQAIVNGKPLFVVKVERHIIEPSGLVHQTLTIVTLRGYTVSHEWADNCYIFHINPLLNIIPEKDEIESHAPLRETWRDDLQLLSDYLDFKSTRTSEGGRYVTESGALTGTVRDYLQALLLLRPHDALHFTRHYFSAALSALDLPHDEYFDPSHKHVRYYFFED